MLLRVCLRALACLRACYSPGKRVEACSCVCACVLLPLQKGRDGIFGDMVAKCRRCGVKLNGGDMLAKCNASSQVRSHAMV